MGLHIAMILDGNRRYAKKNNMPALIGHRKGAETFRNVIDWLDELSQENPERYGFTEMTFYVFSMQNFRRSKREVETLMSLFMKAVNEMMTDKRIEKNKVRIRFIGRIHLLPKKLQERIKAIHEKTKNFKDKIMYFAMAYGGREEIIDAVNTILEEGITEIKEDEFQKYLYMESEPDIIIRTGNVMRTSNFLPWQAIYSEWFFLKKMWPEITKQDIKEVVDEYYNRERRFGR